MLHESVRMKINALIEKLRSNHAYTRSVRKGEGQTPFASCIRLFDISLSALNSLLYGSSMSTDKDNLLGGYNFDKSLETFTTRQLLIFPNEFDLDLLA